MEARLMDRALQWFEGDLPVSSMQARLVGPDAPCRFHTIAFLFMYEGVCEVIGRRSATPGEVLSLEQIQQRIQSLGVPKEKLDIQRAILAEHLSVQAKPEFWLAASAFSASTMLELPVAFLAFGKVVHDDSELILLQTVMGAPLDLVLEHFKKLTIR